MVRSVKYSDIPKLMALDSKQIKWAGVNTLNTIAFDALPALVKDAERDLNFRKDARRALGWRVNKARIDNMEAEVWTNRGWIYSHVTDGKRKPRVGWYHKGRRYILVPRDSVRKTYYTTKGRIRPRIFKRIFIAVKTDGDAYVFYRARGAKQPTLIGYLEREVKNADDLTPQKTVDRLFDEKVQRLFSYNMDRQSRRR